MTAANEREGTMKEQSTVALGALVGALVGATVGYVLFTERGRGLRSRVQPEIEALIREAVRLRSAIGELMGDGGARPRPVASGPLAWPRRSE
jgi:hypothetical protein